MYAARRDHIERVIAPALARGAWVVCDRFARTPPAPTRAPAAARRRTLIAALERDGGRTTEPDLTLILDLPVDVGLARAAGRAGGETPLRGQGRGLPRAPARRPSWPSPRAEPDRCVGDRRPTPPSRPSRRRVWRGGRRAPRDPPVAEALAMPHPRETSSTTSGGEALERAFLDAWSAAAAPRLAADRPRGRRQGDLRLSRRAPAAGRAPPTPAFGLLGARPRIRSAAWSPRAPSGPDGAGARTRGRQGAQGHPGRRGARAAGVLLQVARPARLSRRHHRHGRRPERQRRQRRC